MMRLNASRILVTLAAFLVLTPLTACGSQEEESAAPQKSFTVGLIIPHPLTVDIFNTYRAEMAERGYIEGENITYIQKGPPENVIDLLQMPSQLVDEDVDLIVVVATAGALLAQGATQDIPIVFMAGDAPVEAGLVESLERPGGNVTGIMATGPEARRLELLLEIDPSIKRLYVPYNPTDVVATNSYNEVAAAAETFGIVIVAEPLETDDEVTTAIDNIPEDVDAIFILQDVLVVTEVQAWGEAAIDLKLPLSVPGVDEDPTNSPFPFNPLMGYGLGVGDIASRAARLSDQIFRGTSPGDLPIETAEFYLLVNVDTAEAIGIEIPDHILEQAHFVTGFDKESNR